MLAPGPTNGRFPAKTRTFDRRKGAGRESDRRDVAVSRRFNCAKWWLAKDTPVLAIELAYSLVPQADDRRTCTRKLSRGVTAPACKAARRRPGEVAARRRSRFHGTPGSCAARRTARIPIRTPSIAATDHGAAQPGRPELWSGAPVRRPCRLRVGIPAKWSLRRRSRRWTKGRRVVCGALEPRGCGLSGASAPKLP